MNGGLKIIYSVLFTLRIISPFIYNSQVEIRIRKVFIEGARIGISSA